MTAKLDCSRVLSVAAWTKTARKQRRTYHDGEIECLIEATSRGVKMKVCR